MKAFIVNITYRCNELWEEFLGLFLFKFNFYKFSPNKYKNTFLALDSKSDCKSKNKVKIDKTLEKKIYCFWTGDNPLTPNRKRCLQSLIDNSGVEVRLITPENLNNYILKEYPLHKSYKYLSLVHRADYLRCYFMHHYGGGYSDIKVIENNIADLFDLLSSKSNKWMLGYHEVGRDGVAILDGKLGRDVRINYRYLIGNGAFICKPNSPLTKDWYLEVERRLDFYYEQLKENPGGIWGDNLGYPIPWTNILGSILHPLCLKYKDRLIQRDDIIPSIENYR